MERMLLPLPRPQGVARLPLPRLLSLHEGDCIDVLRTFADNSVDSVVTDPPYNLDSIKKRFGASTAVAAQYGKNGAFGRLSKGFMGKAWDSDVAFRTVVWIEVLRVLKPGGHLLSFGGTRTYHRMACAIEDAGFEIRDQIGWLYGSGMPKSHNVSKGIDKAAGHRRGTTVDTRNGPHTNPCTKADKYGGGYDRQGPDNIDSGFITPDAVYFDGWGTGLKPAWEPIVLARKPFNGSVVRNVLAYGTGVLNIDGCRVETNPLVDDPRLGGAGTWSTGKMAKNVYQGGWQGNTVGSSVLGRWPANVIHDGSDEVLDSFAAFGQKIRGKPTAGSASTTKNVFGQYSNRSVIGHDATGTAARYFYCAKASQKERNGSKHPTVKPLALMRYLCRLITPIGGIVLDPFAGTGTTGQAAMLEGFKYILIESDPHYCIDIRNRLQGRIGL